MANDRKLYVKVETFNPEGRPNGLKVLDIYHPNTASWLQKHAWWAMHNSNTVEINVATPADIVRYVDQGVSDLANKFNRKVA